PRTFAVGPRAARSSAWSTRPLATDAAGLAGLLADGNRRRVFAALILGATTTNEIKAATGLGPRAIGTALARLVDGELVTVTEDERSTPSSVAGIPTSPRSGATWSTTASSTDSGASTGAPADRSPFLRAGGGPSRIDEHAGVHRRRGVEGPLGRPQRVGERV